MEKKFIVRHPDGREREYSGDRVEVDGLGTRILDDQGSIVFTSPNQLEVERVHPEQTD